MPASPFWTNAAIDVLLVIYVIDCAFMGLVIMMQRSKQEGLGAAFGGGITESIWGAQTSSVLVKATVWAAIIFFSISILLARLYSHRAFMSAEEKSGVQMYLDQGASTNAAPAVSPATNAPAASVTTPASSATNVPSPAPSAPAPAATKPTPATPAKNTPK
jgi:preprotein translocase subunit SecG